MDEQTAQQLFATLMAHDRLLQVLLSETYKVIPLDKREQLLADIQKQKPLELPAGIQPDLDKADILAGLALAVREEINRIVATSIRRAPNPAPKQP